MTVLPFAYENELCNVLGRHALTLLLPDTEQGRIQALTERPVGSVIPDLIYIRSPEDAEESDSPRELTAFDASIVAILLHGRPLRSDTIARKLYTRVERLEPRLRALERRGVVKAVGSRVYVLRVRAAPAIRVVAIEAKLKRWREAVRQASAYHAFANEAYVALPESLIRDNKPLRVAAVAARVGVIAVSSEGASLIRSAPHLFPRSPDRVWLLSRTVGLGAISG